MAAPRIPRGSSSPGSPGVSGAIKDAVSAVADAAAPRSLTRRRANLDAAEDSINGTLRDRQSTDRHNR
jgi:hypothetical protein